MRPLKTRTRRVMDDIKGIYKALTAGEITPTEYETRLGKLCDEHGTEYIADAFVKLTKNGEM